MTKTLSIEGMSCGHCVAHVEEALKELCGVKSVKVSLQDKTAVVELAHDVEDKKFKDAIDEAGYELVRVQ